MIKLTRDIIEEIEQIINSGSKAEVARLKHEVVVYEKTSKKRISAPVECRE